MLKRWWKSSLDFLEADMDWRTEAVVFLAYTAGVLGICLFGRWLMWPLKKIGRLIASSLLGGAVLVVLNLLCINFGIFVPVNVVTALITGFLGLPGIIGILIMLNL